MFTIAEDLPWLECPEQAFDLASRFLGPTDPSSPGVKQEASSDKQSIGSSNLFDLAQLHLLNLTEVQSSLAGHSVNGELTLLGVAQNFLLVCQLSHGGLGVVLAADGQQKPANLAQVFSKPELKVWRISRSKPAMAVNAGQSRGSVNLEVNAASKTGEKTRFVESGAATSDMSTRSSNDTVDKDELSATALWKRFLPPRSTILPIVLATITINLLALAIPLATLNIFDRVISNSAFGTLWALAIGMMLAGAFDFLLRNLRSVVIDQMGAASDIKLSSGVFQNILGARADARTMPVGVQSNALRELEGIREYFSSLTITVLGDLPFVVLFLGIIWLVAGKLVLVPLLAMPIIFVVVLIGQLRLRKQAEAGFQDSAHKNSVAVDVTSGIETIKLIGAEEWASKRWQKATASQLKHSLSLRFWTVTSVHMVAFLQGLTTAALLVYGVYLVTDMSLTPGALFAANMLTGRCLGPIASLATILTRLHQMKLALSSVGQLVGMEQEAPHNRTLLTPKSLSQAIRFEGVSFAYAEDRAPVLSNVDLEINPGDRVGIIGSIGSGKSTLLKLLVDLYQPSSGQILWNGVPTHHYDPVLLRRQIGAIFQNPTFFRGTIRDNIMLGRPDAGEAKLIQALQMSGALDWIKRQPLGLDTEIGESGAGLSNGQRQTLAIARAFMGDASCFLFDEPTSDLDSNTERAFVERLNKLGPQATLVLVTHRPLLLEIVNRLIVVEQGKILLDGPKEKVLGQLRDLVIERQNKVA